MIIEFVLNHLKRQKQKDLGPLKSNANPITVHYLYLIVKTPLLTFCITISKKG